MKSNTNSKGFTIIEVVLVLAIAALIFLMIFIALPALQRGQRDNSRKQDASVTATAIQTYRSATRSDTPPTNAQIIEYIDKLDQYEKSTTSILVKSSVTGSAAFPIPTIAPSDSELEEIHVYHRTKCNPDNGQELTKGTRRSSAVVVYLENNGSKPIAFCTDV